MVRPFAAPASEQRGQGHGWGADDHATDPRRRKTPPPAEASGGQVPEKYSLGGTVREAPRPLYWEREPRERHTWRTPQDVERRASWRTNQNHQQTQRLRSS